MSENRMGDFLTHTVDQDQGPRPRTTSSLSGDERNKVKPFWYNTGSWRTDGRTDRQLSRANTAEI